MWNSASYVNLGGDEKTYAMTQIIRKLVKNTAFNTVGYFWSLIVSFFLTPYVIINIGVANFGIWAIIGAVISYFSLADIAVHQPLIKYIAEFHAKKEHYEINKVINVVFLICLLLSVLVLVVGLLLVTPILSLFRITPELKASTFFAFKLGLVTFGVKNLFSVFHTLLVGLQRFGIINKINIYVSILNVLGTIVFLEKGYGFHGIMINALIITIIDSLITLIVSIKIYPSLRLFSCPLNKDVFKKILSFGIVVRITELAGFMNDSIDKLLIGHFLSINMVGFFEVGQRAVNKFRGLLFSLIAPIMPATSEISASHKKEELINFYIKGTKYFNFIIFPCMLFLFLTAGMFMFLWMGYSLGLSYRIPVGVMRILIAGMTINFVTAMGYNIAIGVGKPDIPLKSGLVMLTLNIGLSVPLIIKYGFWGTIVGGAVAVFVGSVVFIVLFNKWLGISNFSFFKHTIAIPLIATVVAGIVTYLGRMGTLLFYLEFFPRLKGFEIFIVSGILFMSVYLYIVLRSNYFDKSEITFLKNICSRKFLL
ncbi:MAG: oligosaccharide flippase family protein [bacterium]|nr:oligosaccharide flippase family protein [bacterium]